jgi:hypothetical protein
MNVAPPVIAPKSNSTDTGSQVTVIRIINAATLDPPIPGKKDEIIESAVPRAGIRILGNEKTFPSPSERASK